MSISSTFFGRRAPADHAVLLTPNGLRSIPGASPYPDTYAKTIPQLWGQLRPHRRAALMKTIMHLNKESYCTLINTLTLLSDPQFDVLVEVLDYAPTSKFQKFVKICANPYTVFNDYHDTVSTNEGSHSSDTRSKKSFDAKIEDTWHQPNMGQSTACSKLSTRTEESSPRSVIPSLWKHIHHDALTMIWDEVVKQRFSRGFVFPKQNPIENGHYIFQGRPCQGADPSVLLALNQSLLAKYQRAIYENNMWVIGAGCYKSTVPFLDWMKDDYLQIRSVHLSFSMDDIECLTELVTATYRELQDERQNCQVNNILLLERFVVHYNHYTRQLLSN